MNATDYRSDAIGLIRTEHRTMAALLHAMKHLVNEIRCGRAEPDFPLLRAMVYYIDAFPERMHHPKEEAYLFAPLAQRTQEANADLRILRDEHADGERLIRILGHMLLRYEHEPDTGFAAFAATVETFADFYRKHMEREERDLLPVALKVLLPEDWISLQRAFAENHDPLRHDASEAHFRNLFTHIVNITPPPMGVGPPAVLKRMA